MPFAFLAALLTIVALFNHQQLRLPRSAGVGSLSFVASL